MPLNLEEVNRRSKHTLSDHLGIVFIDMGDDYLKASMPVDERTCQPMGILNGGASTALAETVASAAANFCVDQTQKICVGLEINANHLRPARTGSTVTAIAKPLHLGKTTQVWEIKIHNEFKQLICISRLTLAVLSKS